MEISDGFPLRVNQNLPHFPNLRDTISIRDFHLLVSLPRVCFFVFLELHVLHHFSGAHIHLITETDWIFMRSSPIYKSRAFLAASCQYGLYGAFVWFVGHRTIDLWLARCGLMYAQPRSGDKKRWARQIGFIWVLLQYTNQGHPWLRLVKTVCMVPVFGSLGTKWLSSGLRGAVWCMSSLVVETKRWARQIRFSCVLLQHTNQGQPWLRLVETVCMVPLFGSLGTKLLSYYSLRGADWCMSSLIRFSWVLLQYTNQGHPWLRHVKTVCIVPLFSSLGTKWLSYGLQGADWCVSSLAVETKKVSQDRSDFHESFSNIHIKGIHDCVSSRRFIWCWCGGRSMGSKLMLLLCIQNTSLSGCHKSMFSCSLRMQQQWRTLQQGSWKASLLL